MDEGTVIRVNEGESVLVIRPDATMDLHLAKVEDKWNKGQWLAAGVALLVNDRAYVQRLVEATMDKLTEGRKV